MAAVSALQARGINCELLQDTMPRMYYKDQHGKCPYVLRLKDSTYDVGFDQQADGSFAPVFDEYGNTVGKVLANTAPNCPVPKNQTERAAKQIGLFLQEYGKAATIEAAAMSGMYVESEQVDEATGEYALTFAGH